MGGLGFCRIRVMARAVWPIGRAGTAATSGRGRGPPGNFGQRVECVRVCTWACTETCCCTGDL
eukprot:8258183-Alexandrium_andersonii.AAC.1